MNVVGPVGIVLRSVRVIFRRVGVWWPVWIVRSLFVSTTIGGRIVPASSLSGHYGAAAKRSGSLCRSNRGLPMILRGLQFAIRTRRLYVLDLRRHWPDMAFASRGLLLGRRSRVDAAVAAVITHARNSDVVVHHRRVVHVVDFGHVDVIHRTVVVEAPAVPAATFIPAAKISVAVIDPAVKTYDRSPISFVKHKRGSTPGPISRSPQETNFRRQHPSSRHPVIVYIVGVPGPITWGPDIPLSLANRLHVYRQLPRWEAHRHANTHLCGHGRWQHRYHSHQRHRRYQQTNCIG